MTASMLPLVAVVVQLYISVEGRGTTLAPAFVRRLSSIIYTLLSVFLAVDVSGRGKGAESYATVQGLGTFVVFPFGVVTP